MKKQGLLNLLEQLKARNELLPSSAPEYNETPTEICVLLVDYINDAEIRDAVNAIPTGAKL